MEQNKNQLKIINCDMLKMLVICSISVQSHLEQTTPSGKVYCITRDDMSM